MFLIFPFIFALQTFQLVIIMFDAHKLDISDELKGVMELFIPHLDKIRVVLNKADSILDNAAIPAAIIIFLI